MINSTKNLVLTLSVFFGMLIIVNTFFLLSSGQNILGVTNTTMPPTKYYYGRTTIVTPRATSSARRYATPTRSSSNRVTPRPTQPLSQVSTVDCIALRNVFNRYCDTRFGWIVDVVDKFNSEYPNQNREELKYGTESVKCDTFKEFLSQYCPNTLTRDSYTTPTR